MNDIGHGPLEENVVTKDKSASGKSRAVWMEEKSVLWTRDIVFKFSKPGQAVLEPRVGTFDTVKACMMAPKHRRRVGCGTDAVCCDESMASVVEAVARQVLNGELTIARSKKAQVDAGIYREAEKAIEPKRRAMVWRSPLRHSTTLTFPMHISHFLSHLFKILTFFEIGCQLSVSGWSPKWRSRFYTTNSDAVQVVGCSAVDVTITK